jgi:hypothetical protein
MIMKDGNPFHHVGLGVCVGGLWDGSAGMLLAAGTGNWEGSLLLGSDPKIRWDGLRLHRLRRFRSPKFRNDHG